MVELVRPVVDGGRFPAKGAVGADVVVHADVYVDGHDKPDASLWARRAASRKWTEIPMRPLGNDRWEGRFVPDCLGPWQFRVSGWLDRWETWRHGTKAKADAGQDVSVEIQAGTELLDSVSAADSAETDMLEAARTAHERGALDDILANPSLDALMRRRLDRQPENISRICTVTVEPEHARFSSWYEFFPRSSVDGTNQPNTLVDAIDRLDYVADLGFDVVYLPPIHPIGRTYRKGPNNTLEAGENDPGSPWAIGAEEGGHTAVAPELGTVADVTKLASACAERGMHLALDLAFQCAPDHPWVKEHPEWFVHRADGTIQYAENPPKKYQDIYPLDFTGSDWQGLWNALKDVVEFWVDAGVTVFRVDNPHTKPFPFWEWLISQIRARHPEVIFLAEAFNRPRIMEMLGKVGFSQSYTYFTWRQERWEIEEYFTELATRTLDFLRPNAWPNTPDILTEQLQHGGRPVFVTRAILAATLSPSWGVYGPAFELVERTAVREGSEEYLDSEKYQRRSWDLDQPHTLAPLLMRLNEIRRMHSALQHLDGLHFHRCDNQQLICYTKVDPGCNDRVLVIVNLDPWNAQSGWVDIDLKALDLPYDSEYELHDEIGGGTYGWRGNMGWVELDPNGLAAHVFSVTPIVPTHHEGRDDPEANLSEAIAHAEVVGQ